MDHGNGLGAGWESGGAVLVPDFSAVGFVGRHPSLKHTSPITNECCSKGGDVFEASLGIWHVRIAEAVDCQHVCNLCYLHANDVETTKKHNKLKCSSQECCDGSDSVFNWRFTAVRLKKSVIT